MDCTLLVEFMLFGIEEIQMSILENPDKGRKLTEVLMISYALIKMVNTGIYVKYIERWKNLTTADWKQWVELCAFFIAEYELMLREGKGPTNSKEG